MSPGTWDRPGRRVWSFLGGSAVAMGPEQASCPRMCLLRWCHHYRWIPTQQLRWTSQMRSLPGIDKQRCHEHWIFPETSKVSLSLSTCPTFPTWAQELSYHKWHGATLHCYPHSPLHLRDAVSQQWEATLAGHSAEEKTKAQRGAVTCQRSPSRTYHQFSGIQLTHEWFLLLSALLLGEKSCFLQTSWLISNTVLEQLQVPVFVTSGRYLTLLCLSLLVCKMAIIIHNERIHRFLWG